MAVYGSTSVKDSSGSSGTISAILIHMYTGCLGLEIINTHMGTYHLAGNFHGMKNLWKACKMTPDNHESQHCFNNTDLLVPQSILLIDDVWNVCNFIFTKTVP